MPNLFAASRPWARPIPKIQWVTALLWPSFLLAGLATVVFFTFLNPTEILGCAGEPPFSATGAYSVGFFAFWLLCLSSSVATDYFLQTQTNPAPDENIDE